VHAGNIGQVTNFTVMCSNAKHCVDQYIVLFHCCSLGNDTAMPGGLHARLCHAFLVTVKVKNSKCRRNCELSLHFIIC